MSAPTFPAPELYPFDSRWFETDEGRLHYIDEGPRDDARPIVFVHGMPTWSFLWRRLIAALSAQRRCIAVDHLGFGLSHKPADADYHPRAHSERLSALLDHLGVRDVTLVVHDFGGPIGLGHAVRHPEKVRELVLFNTWMWSTADDPGAQKVDRIVSGWMGAFMYRRLNASAKWLVPTVLAKGNRLAKEAHQHYIKVTGSADERNGQLAMARNLVGASDWYDALWNARDAFAHKPTLLVWGMQDPAIGPAHLERWEGALTRSETVRLDGSGHFPQEEAPYAVERAVLAFLASDTRIAA